jgi:UDP:flavonoid glycosyltransferase YjiC (YdhE family)
MFFEKNNSGHNAIKVLVAPLDWGLGHATRCIPIIYRLLNNGVTVFIAADGAIKELLQKELPQVVFLPLPGYKIRYSRTRGGLPFTLLLQLPKLLRTIYKEHQWLKTACKTYGFNAVISDNRPGLYNSKVHSIYITHQLTIKTGNRITQRLVQKMHYWFINKYDQCWVPDNETANSLAGDLSHPKQKPGIPVVYTGALSRFEKKEIQKKYDLLILLSGPEPQRTIFENMLLQQITALQKKILFIRGLPGNIQPLANTRTCVEMHNHLNAAALNTAIQQSEQVICRSGYTTVMDLMTLQAKAVVVPTPGQTEQEYLGLYLDEKKLCCCIPQHKFTLIKALEQAAAFPYTAPVMENTQYKICVDKLTALLQQQKANS